MGAVCASICGDKNAKKPVPGAGGPSPVKYPGPAAAKPVLSSYKDSPAIYTEDVMIANNVPQQSGGGDATSFKIDKKLPEGLAFDTKTGVISGTPKGPVAAQTFTITATNAQGSSSATLEVTVKEAKGNLKVWVKSGKALKNVDGITGGFKSDPKCYLMLGSQTYETDVIWNNLNPEWKQAAPFVFRDLRVKETSQVKIDIWDMDQKLGKTEVVKSKQMGDCVLSVSQEKKGNSAKTTEEVKMKQGSITVEYQFERA